MELLLKETYTDTKVLTSGHSSIGLGKTQLVFGADLNGATKKRNLTNPRKRNQKQNHWFVLQHPQVQQETMDEIHHDSNI